MHQNVGLLPGLFDEVICLLEKAVELIIFVVLGGNVEVEGYVLFGVGQVAASGY